ncbi:MAG TPA: glycosyltransferase family 4 protein [Candidatus Limnocylindrales bacterium]
MNHARVLLVTNDFPPRVGGIQQYCHDLMSGLAPELVTVFAPSWPGAEEFDSAAPYRVIRHPATSMTTRYGPIRGLADQVVDLVRRLKVEVVCIGAAYPLGLLAGRLRNEGGVPCIGFTHGLEVAVTRLPVKRQLMMRIAAEASVLTAVSEWTAARLRRVAGRQCRIELLAPPVSLQRFHPAVDGSAIRRRHGLGDAPVCVCVSRFVPRKGQDRLIATWPYVVSRVPGASLLLVGTGRDEQRLRRLAAASEVSTNIHFAGQAPAPELAAHYAAGDVFAMPCRTRAFGTDLEALGIAFLEAAAVGLPVIAGSSGGAPETVAHGVTGLVVNGAGNAAVGKAIADLLADPARARAMGDAGHRRIRERFALEAVSERFNAILASVAMAR